MPSNVRQWRQGSDLRSHGRPLENWAQWEGEACEIEIELAPLVCIPAFFAPACWELLPLACLLPSNRLPPSTGRPAPCSLAKFRAPCSLAFHRVAALSEGHMRGSPLQPGVTDVSSGAGSFAIQDRLWNGSLMCHAKQTISPSHWDSFIEG
jgi:hypothetical protein